jgi:flagellar hook-associated protein 2
VKAWIDVVTTSSINQDKQLVLFNGGATYEVLDAVGSVKSTIITGNTGTSSDLAGFSDTDVFNFTYGNDTYVNADFTSSTTIGDVQSWVASALATPTSSIDLIGDKHTLVLSDTTDLTRSYSQGLLGLGESQLKRPTVVSAQDAAFTLDGIDYTRTSNTVTDALSGITINLIKSDTTSQSISVNKGADKTPQVIQGLVDSYNDLVATAKKLSAKSSPSSTASTDGSLANSPTALSFLSLDVT